MVKICEVVDGCEDCPKYGDDCDGDKMTEHTDLISRADAMGAVQDHFNANGFKGYDDGQKMMDRIKALPSAEAVQIPIKLEKRYPESKDEDITDAFMRGYLAGRSSADAVQGVGRYENAMQKLREMPKCLNGVKAKQIKKIPSDAVQGEWQKVEEQPYFRKHYDTVCCSVCRKKGNRKWNFCPSCGARMKGGAE